MSNIQEKAEQYAREKLGNWYHIVHSAYEISQCTNGEVSVQDYTAGYNESKRWIPVGERLPELKKSEHWHGLKSDQILVKLKDGNCDIAFAYSCVIDGLKSVCFINKSTACLIIDVIEWREI